MSSTKSNLLLGRTGKRYWQDESEDHWVRKSSEFERIIHSTVVRRRLAGETACPTHFGSQPKNVETPPCSAYGVLSASQMLPVNSCMAQKSLSFTTALPKAENSGVRAVWNGSTSNGSPVGRFVPASRRMAQRS